MATKTKAKATKEKLYFLPELYMEDYPSCCGSQVLAGLNMDEARVQAYPKPKRESWMSDEDWKWELDDWKRGSGKTKDECYRHILKYVGENRGSRHIQMIFVKRFKGQRKGDMPNDFKGFLEENGWYCIDEFVNPNHGNLLCVMGKTFRNVPKPKAYASFARGWW